MTHPQSKDLLDDLRAGDTAMFSTFESFGERALYDKVQVSLVLVGSLDLPFKPAVGAGERAVEVREAFAFKEVGNHVAALKLAAVVPHIQLSGYYVGNVGVPEGEGGLFTAVDKYLHSGVVGGTPTRGARLSGAPSRRSSETSPPGRYTRV